MKSDMRIKKELEDFHKTVILYSIFSHKNQISRLHYSREIIGIGKVTFPDHKIQYIKEDFIKLIYSYRLSILTNRQR